MHALTPRGRPDRSVVLIQALLLLAGVCCGGASALAAPATPSGTMITAAAPQSSLASARAPQTRFNLDLSAQMRAFPSRGPLDQARLHPSVAVAAEFSHAWNDGRDSVTLNPFLRLDAEDQRRTRGDLRQAYYSHVGDAWELHLGFRRVFWGVVESKHLVDVINQVDLIEDLDEETRLGQPMAQLVLLRDSGTLELFALPGARARTFPGRDGRLTGPVRIDADARFTDGADSLATSWAVRWSGDVAGIEYGIAHFSGTARDPRFELTAPPLAGVPLRLRPVYETLSRTSLDLQYIVGDTALKLELLARRGQGPASTAFVAGFEHTVVGAFGSRVDLGLLAEYLFDDRGDEAPLLAFEHDVFLGLRLALNDLAGTGLLAGAIVDHRTGETIVSLEASRRIGDRWRIDLDLRGFSGSRVPPPGDAAALVDPGAKWGVLDDEDYLQLEITRYF